MALYLRFFVDGVANGVYKPVWFIIFVVNNIFIDSIVYNFCRIYDFY